MKTQLLTYVGLALGMAAACHSEPLPDAFPPPAAAGQPAAGSDSANGSAGSGQAPSGGAGGSGVAGNSHAGQAQAGSGASEGGSGGEPPEPPVGGAADQPDSAFEGPSRCTSGKTRDPNESEGPEMNPGFPCIFCHAASNAATGEGDAPIFAFAGTLYAHGHEPSSCIGGGQGAAQVVVKDADGQELSAVANPSGNFLFEDAILAPPFSAKVVFEGRERAAKTPHTNPDCNFCHSETGLQDAPGRVALP